MTPRLYRAVALALTATFAVVGLAFFFAPGGVAAVFDRLAPPTSMPAGDVGGGLFRVLAAAYMYLVAWVAWMMFRRPDEAVWPAILAQAKLASAAFSLVLIFILGPSLVLAANATVDGCLGFLALWLRHQASGRRAGGQAPAP
jgi:hypothetical protein